jgi:Virulence-associated protein E-like domain/NrS-1  polymerase HBD domain
MSRDDELPNQGTSQKGTPHVMSQEASDTKIEPIPNALREIPQWVCWQLQNRDGRNTKVPINPNTGQYASTTDPTTWDTYDVARALATKRKYGVGFVFTVDAGVVGIDLDHCMNKEAGQLAPWAQEVIAKIDSYTEVSPSGDGIHILLKATMPADGKHKKQMGNGTAIEIYNQARYFTVTGKHFPGTPTTVEERQHEFDALYAQLFSSEESIKRSKRSATLKDQNLLEEEIPIEHDIPIEDLYSRLQAALRRDPVLSRLWLGTTIDYDKDHSRADLAFCAKLFRIFGPNRKAIDEIFRQSGLMRDKWEREDYREWTLNKAMDGKVTGSRTKITLREIVQALETYPCFCDAFWYDEFLQRGLTGNPAREWTDRDDLEMAVKIQGMYGFHKAGVETIRQAIATAMMRRCKNCVKGWLDSLKWDETPRIDCFFPTYFRAEDTEYTRAVSKNFWLSMVARVYRPGCQVDNMVVLEGPQGIGKSRALRIIGGDWFTEQHESATGRAFFEVLQGKLLVEISEMDSFSRAEVTRVKQVVTSPNDRFRAAYGRRAEDHPRQSIFVGTTNRDDWNRDETGARRFWPIKCQGSVDVDGIIADRPQLFAEAVVRFKVGETWWNTPAEETLAEQAARYAEPVWVQPILHYIENDLITPADDVSLRDRWAKREAPLTELSMNEVLGKVLKIPQAQWPASQPASRCTRLKVSELGKQTDMEGRRKEEDPAMARAQSSEADW